MNMGRTARRREFEEKDKCATALGYAVLACSNEVQEAVLDRVLDHLPRGPVFFDLIMTMNIRNIKPSQDKVETFNRVVTARLEELKTARERAATARRKKVALRAWNEE